MSVPPDKIPLLPRVASSPKWSWHYFRMRYLTTLSSGLVVVAAVWLWSLNLPGSKAGANSDGALPVDPSSSMQRQAGALVSTNLPDLQTTVTNGSLGLGGGL
jgi:hypothetical protein